ncbi:archaellin/type IV pilin N-terminal domain-containing protein [Haloglomus salinum]|uniref:archaellin/type IV pilin N-terminal domain-containing protein n=1 Tax=Haloglomus salinum TaxID=2962673 RepID=UPI0020C9B2B8|nr:archaellin/type IV pilin N-terminal domain-containing protein [Haloglomus salinum]
MFENIHNDEERGQVGIGTLIVFIALVLVAAIAAGVLINTAGFLQNQAESTGQESTNQVTNGVNVIGSTGIYDGSSGTVDNVTITVSLSPGADPVDLTDAQVEFLGSSASIKELEAADITAVKGSGTTLSDSSDRMEIFLDLTGSTDLPAEQMSPGDEAEVVITTEDGSQTTEVLNVPDPVGDKTAVML